MCEGILTMRERGKTPRKSNVRKTREDAFLFRLANDEGLLRMKRNGEKGMFGAGMKNLPRT